VIFETKSRYLHCSCVMIISAHYSWPKSCACATFSRTNGDIQQDQPVLHLEYPQASYRQNVASLVERICKQFVLDLAVSSFQRRSNYTSCKLRGRHSMPDVVTDKCSIVNSDLFMTQRSGQPSAHYNALRRPWSDIQMYGQVVFSEVSPFHNDLPHLRLH
jgi:hypothetical protein